jgi:hypothetical protein
MKHFLPILCCLAVLISSPSFIIASQIHPGLRQRKNKKKAERPSAQPSIKEQLLPFFNTIYVEDVAMMNGKNQLIFQKFALCVPVDCTVLTLKKIIERHTLISFDQQTIYARGFMHSGWADINISDDTTIAQIDKEHKTSVFNVYKNRLKKDK